MSFGGSVSTMISSIRNNARAKRKTLFERDYQRIKKEEKTNNLSDIKASPEQLADIRDKLIKANIKDTNKRLILITIVALVVIISILLIF